MLTKNKTDFTEGPIFWKITKFALPIMLTGVLQMLYSMADNIVVGRFSGDPNALGAVGSTSAITSLVINFLVGASSGSGVVVSQEFGAKNEEKLSRAIHTSLLFSFLAGLLFSIISFVITRPSLVLMETQSELLEGAVLYMQIVSFGILGTSVYNYASTILRSLGDSKTPLIIGSCAGILNVLLNLFFVIGCKMTVDGVAIATVISQYASAVAVLIALNRRKGQPDQFKLSRLCLDGKLLKRILRLGIPAGLTSATFSISGVILTNGINTLSKEAISAFTITNNIDGITYLACTSFMHAALTFSGQNYGAKKPERIKKSLLYSLIQVTVVGIALGMLELIFAEELASLFVSVDDPSRAEILRITKEMVTLLLSTYFICGIMDVFSGTLRGIGYSLTPTIITLSCVCGFRILWRFFVFPLEGFNSAVMLMLCYPISWAMTTIAHAITFALSGKKLKKLKTETA